MSDPVYDHTTIRVRSGSAGPVLAILAERRRQVDAKGFTPEHDNDHHGREIAQAASAYAMAGAGRYLRADQCWPIGWGDLPRDDSPERALVKAGALIVAELERLERLKP